MSIFMLWLMSVYAYVFFFFVAFIPLCFLVGVIDVDETSRPMAFLGQVLIIALAAGFSVFMMDATSSSYATDDAEEYGRYDAQERPGVGPFE